MITPAHLKKRKEKLYAWMFDFTAIHCTRCRESGCACKDSICAHVEQQTRARGFDFERTGHALRFIGCNGCVVPPHQRETCTIYLCDEAKNAPNFPREQYSRLIRIIGRLEWRLMELETHQLEATPK